MRDARALKVCNETTKHDVLGEIATNGTIGSHTDVCRQVSVSANQRDCGRNILNCPVTQHQIQATTNMGLCAHGDVLVHGRLQVLRGDPQHDLVQPATGRPAAAAA